MRVTQSGMDLNLLTALDALLEECSVSGAAQRMHLSEPAMSRTLGRIRKALGDPILVRAGRSMVPTPHALAIRAEVRVIVERARTLFTAAGEVDLRTLSRTFTVLAHDAFTAACAEKLFARAAREAPGVRLKFLGEGYVDAPALREGIADLEVGVIDTVSPEVHTEHLFDDRMVACVRVGHPLLEGRCTPERFAAAEHLIVSRRGKLHGPVDAALAELGLTRRVVGTVPTFPSSLFVLGAGDLVGLVAEQLTTMVAEMGLRTFEVPLDLPPLPMGLAWHPRNNADPGHAWLRGCLRDVMTGLTE
ncbi:LysR family transcriptional regulator [Embleya sp. NPDC050493]|uniref:LysR family transcriptional regulator n=1 Tax=Embleya sp. NPDC050493 TaxID=3363989 RepID=UPI003796C787